MIKKTITYTDYNGLERTEDFYFNLTKAELLKMEACTASGLGSTLQKIANGMDIPKIVQFFEDFVLTAYGEKSEDGRRFDKTEEVKNNLKYCEAYSTLYMELSQDAKKASEFIIGVIPSDLAAEVEKQQPTLMAPKN